MRTSQYPNLDEMLLQRWSPRSFSSEPLTDDMLYTLFEAARWSPSCFNEQPWHFVYARSRDHLSQMQSILVDANRKWAGNAPLLITVFSSKTFGHNNQPNRWANFDTGAAWMALALQANKLGLHCHAMGGFDEQKAYEVTGVDAQQYQAICVIAVGKRAPVDQLPQELREREIPSERKGIAEFIHEGTMT